MYDYIKGELVSKTSNSKGNFITVEAHGVGYKCEVTSRDYSSVQSGDVKIYIELIHREDRMYLCGFINHESRDIFNILTSVSGVGTKMAFALLDKFETTELISFVINNNYKDLTNAKGVGPKLAQKIVLELKDKLTTFNSKLSIPLPVLKVNDNRAIEDVTAVLSSLGYTGKEIETAIVTVSSELNADAETEDILKNALRILSQQTCDR